MNRRDALAAQSGRRWRDNRCVPAPGNARQRSRNPRPHRTCPPSGYGVRGNQGTGSGWGPIPRSLSHSRSRNRRWRWQLSCRRCSSTAWSCFRSRARRWPVTYWAGQCFGCCRRLTPRQPRQASPPQRVDPFSRPYSWAGLTQTGQRQNGAKRSGEYPWCGPGHASAPCRVRFPTSRPKSRMAQRLPAHGCGTAR